MARGEERVERGAWRGARGEERVERGAGSGARGAGSGARGAGRTTRPGHTPMADFTLQADLDSIRRSMDLSDTTGRKKAFTGFDPSSSILSYAGVFLLCLAVVSLASGCKSSGLSQSDGSAHRGKRTERVKANGLNLRGGPTTKAAVLAVLKQGERVVIEDRKGNWIKVRRGGGNTRGWVYGAYLTGFSIATPVKPAPSAGRISKKETSPIDEPEEDLTSEIGGKITTIADEEPPPDPSPGQSDELETLSPKETLPIE
ncbi:MAG: SH3 domain-containing protein [Desulfobacterales bacterium]|nr:SH3 domain-containing protein [Desulfobacterales bacterium]